MKLKELAPEKNQEIDQLLRAFSTDRANYRFCIKWVVEMRKLGMTDGMIVRSFKLLVDDGFRL